MKHFDGLTIAKKIGLLVGLVMACMAMDVVHVIQKGRHPFTAMTVKFEGERAHEHPRRFVSMSIDFGSPKFSFKQVGRFPDRSSRRIRLERRFMS